MEDAMTTTGTITSLYRWAKDEPAFRMLSWELARGTADTAAGQLAAAARLSTFITADAEDSRLPRAEALEATKIAAGKGVEAWCAAAERYLRFIAEGRAEDAA